MGMYEDIGFRHRVWGPEGLPTMENRLERTVESGNQIMYRRALNIIAGYVRST